MENKGVFSNLFKIKTSLEFKAYMVEENIRRSNIFAIAIIIVESLFCIIAMIYYNLHIRLDFFYKYYVFMYLLMIVINGLWLMYIKKYSGQKIKKEHLIKRREYLLIAYIIFIISWGSLIALLDQRLYGQIVSYIINLFACAIIYYLDHKKSLIVYGISTAVLVIGLPFMQVNRDIIIGHYINISILVFWAWLASRILYYHFYTNFKKQELLRECNFHLEETNRKLKDISLKDELTQIGNRRALNEYIEELTKYSVKEAEKIFVMIIDVDWFKLYNDTYGHLEGDKVLVKVAREIQSLSCKNNKFCSRFGGEEYVYMGVGCSKEAFLEQGELLRQSILGLEIPHEATPNYGKVTISIGISSTQLYEKKAIIECINSADKALYEAKEQGKNCIVYHVY